MQPVKTRAAPAKSSGPRPRYLGRGPEDFAGAARVFTGCILNRPDHAHAYYCRANAYLRLERYEYAAADTTTAVKLDPTHASAWYNRGVAHYKLRQREKAVGDFSKAIELDPNHW